MEARFAFTARYWGDSAVVCRAAEGRPGPIVDQEFGQFKTWTQANEFATRLNEGLGFPSSEVQQIVTGSVLRASHLMSELDSAECAGDHLRDPLAGMPVRVQFMLAELDLAVTFCRIVRSKPSEHDGRMLQHARNAFFDAMHYLSHARLSPHDIDAITGHLGTLQAAFQECSPEREDSIYVATEKGSDSDERWRDGRL
jgi:hypothetical protein